MVNRLGPARNQPALRVARILLGGLLARKV
jgi:hypothetical protein